MRYTQKAMYAQVIVVLVALVAQTSQQTIDLTPFMGLFMTLISVIIPVILIVVIFRVIGKLFDGLSNIFNAVRIRLLPLLALPAAVAQTTTPAIDTGATVSIIYAIFPLLLTVVIISILFRVIGKIPDMIR